ncbi:hypothetical protein C3F09_01220 [candidate division GN15 bacterium]|uniref:FtsX-like permease family protein n=1 Tax=candidate division GN15 bacterium TaxID=2072418 RepID=A0A855X7E2_9BACT|nr:MAG: hypothetical protein C3F09_01220 [candidate division GN15 bacterium]
MLKNYLITAFRNLRRHKGYSVINIAGLAIGMASCLLIYLYVWHELSYDTYHADYDRIYRISTQTKNRGIAGCSENVADYLRANCPEVERVFRIQNERPAAVRVGDKTIQVENIKHADNDLLSMFRMPLIEGDPRAALVRPMTAVLTRAVADQLFGGGTAVGQTIRIDTLDYEVTGVVANSPTNTHLKFGIITSWASFDMIHQEPFRRTWDGGFFCTYVRLASGVDKSRFESRIASLIEDHAGESLRQRGEQARLFLQPVADIHLHSNLQWEQEPPGNVTYVWVLALVGGMILLIAGLNFMNLASARAAARSAEVGLRKVVGATRSQLLQQFMGEMILTAGIALALATVIADLALPAFNQLAGAQYRFRDILTGPGLPIMICVVVVAGGLAGLYPALILSAFRPVRVLKGATAKGGGGVMFRRIIVAAQFVMAIVLIAGSLTVYSQIDFMRTRSLGFNPEQKLVIEMPTNAVNGTNYKTVKSEFLSHTVAKGATFSSSVPGRWNYQWRTFPFGEEATNTHSVHWYQVDRDFLNEYGIEIIAGSPFGPDCNGAMCEGAIINEAAVATFGWSSPEEALTRKLWTANRPVVGVAKNFHFRGLQTAVEPMGLFIMGEDFRYLTLRLDASDVAAAVNVVRQKYSALFPDKPLSWFFLDQDFDKQYRAEQRLGMIFGIFTALGIFVAALGLFGLASYSAQQRTKEIGIRKVLGATEGSLVGLLTREILLIVAAAIVIALPLAYVAGTKWLEQFAFRTSVGWSTLLLASFAAFAVAVLSVGYQAVRAARANPVESLKYE